MLRFVEPELKPLKLESVQELLNYLHRLPQGCEDRALSWNEDSFACILLRRLPEENDVPHLSCLVEYYSEEQYRKSRSLSVWYAIARAVARMIQENDGSCF